MAIRLVIHITAKPGQGRKYAELFAAIARETRSEPGCQEYELFASTEDPDRLTLLERWTDRAALEAHSAVNRKRDFTALNAAREGDMTREIYDV